MRTMINSEAASANADHRLASLAGLYPHAFAMVAAHNPSARLAVQRFELAALHGSNNPGGPPLEGPLPASR